MSHPWLHIPIADYESHMALPSVAQAGMLARLLQRVVRDHRPRSLAILGVAGGNGLECMDPEIVRRVVAVDLNGVYLDVCTQRHAASFEQFEPVLHDLSLGPPDTGPVDCVFAGLVLEYLPQEAIAGCLPPMLHGGGVLATVLQLPAPGLPEVSSSPFTSLLELEDVFHYVDPGALEETLRACGFARLSRETVGLDSGKSFEFATWRKSGPTKR